MAFQPFDEEVDTACPLSACQLRVLQAAWDTECTQASVLAERLCLSAETVRTYFARILTILETHDRCGAVAHAAKHGWIRTSPPPPRRRRSRRSGLNRPPKRNRAARQGDGKMYAIAD